MSGLEVFGIIRGFWSVLDAYNSANINKAKSKRLANRRNELMTMFEGHSHTIQSEAMKRLKEFDKEASAYLNTFSAKNFLWKMMFNKDDDDKFIYFSDYLNDLRFDLLAHSDLCSINPKVSRNSANNGDAGTLGEIRVDHNQQNMEDIVNDYITTKNLLKDNIDAVINSTDAQLIKLNFLNYTKYIRKMVENGTIESSALQGVVESIDEDVSEMTTKLEKVVITGDITVTNDNDAIKTATAVVSTSQDITSTTTTPTALLIEPQQTTQNNTNIFTSINSEKEVDAVETEEVEYQVRTRSATSIEEKDSFLQYWKDWFATFVKGIRPSNRSKYAEILYISNITTEARLHKKLKENSANWLSEKGFSEEDSDDIFNYFFAEKVATQPLVVAAAEPPPSTAAATAVEKEKATRKESVLLITETDTSTAATAAVTTSPPAVPVSVPPAVPPLTIFSALSRQSSQRITSGQNSARNTANLIKINKKYPNGDHYDGYADNFLTKNDNLKQGQGKLIYGNKSIYEGEFKDDKRHGFGKMMYFNGDVYEGCFSDDIKHGLGKYRWQDGTIYEGEWNANKMHGFGVYVWSNGFGYEGQWRYDKKHGIGKYTWADGDSYQGEWSEGNKHGKGVYLWSCGDCYEGEYVDDKRSGKGKMTYINRDVYEGEFKDEKRSGFGRMKYANGQVFEGMWSDDMRNGHGKIKYINGTVYEGLFKNDVREWTAPAK